MSLAILSSQRSKDPSTQVGACIVNKDKRVIGMGYNGLPDGCKDDRFPWGKAAHECCCECGCGCDECQCSKRRKVEYKWLKDKNFYVCHAELNAIVNSYGNSVRGCTVYVTLFPCNECTKLLIQSGIARIVYYSDKHKDRDTTKASKWMLDYVKVEYTEHKKLDKNIFDMTNEDLKRIVESEDQQDESANN
ncbi:unnamed protein product [Clavelina lepadiformis]|uniref:dCMP deaminase n=1 Tax=Clavelina lepadiformis TaxID=159417 RepID=A0ABP0GZE4_CLALP